MTEWQRIIWGSIFTIFGGVIVFAIGQLLNELRLKPYLRYKAIIAEIDEELIYFSNIYSNAGQFCIDHKEACLPANERLRRLGSKLSAVYNQVRWLESTGDIIGKSELDEVVGCLIGLSNGLWNSEAIEHNLRRSESIRKILKL